VDRIVCLSDPTKCFGVDTLLVGDTGLFSTVDGPASLWNCLHGSISCSPCLRAYMAGYLPPVGLYGFHSLGGGRGGGGSVGKGGSSIGLSGSGSGSGSGSSGMAGVGSSSSMGLSDSGSEFGSSGMAGVGSLSSMGLSDSGLGFGSTYNSIKECSCLCPWLQRRGERAHCNGKGGLGGLGRGRGRGLGCRGGDSDWVGDKGCTISGARSWDSCGKADGKMMAWLLVSGAGMVDRVGPDDEGGNEDEGE